MDPMQVFPPGDIICARERQYTEETTSGAAPTSPLEGVVHRIRHMQLDEQSGRTTGRLGYSPRHRWDGSAGTTILYHPSPRNLNRRPHSSRIIKCRTHSPSKMTTGPFSDYAAGGLSRSTPRQADDTTTRHSGSGPTRQSDDRGSESDCSLRPTRHGSGGTSHD